MNIKFKKSVTLEELETLVKALKIKPFYNQNSCGCGEGWNDERCDELSKNTNCLDCIFSYIELINKPVETTNEQPKIPQNLRIEIMKIMSKHTELRNSDKITDKDLYHAFLDWEKEMWKII